MHDLAQRASDIGPMMDPPKFRGPSLWPVLRSIVGWNRGRDAGVRLDPRIVLRSATPVGTLISK